MDFHNIEDYKKQMKYFMAIGEKILKRDFKKLGVKPKELAHRAGLAHKQMRDPIYGLMKMKWKLMTDQGETPDPFFESLSKHNIAPTKEVTSLIIDNYCDAAAIKLAMSDNPMSHIYGIKDDNLRRLPSLMWVAQHCHLSHWQWFLPFYQASNVCTVTGSCDTEWGHQVGAYLATLKTLRTHAEKAVSDLEKITRETTVVGY